MHLVLPGEILVFTPFVLLNKHDFENMQGICRFCKNQAKLLKAGLKKHKTVFYVLKYVF